MPSEPLPPAPELEDDLSETAGRCMVLDDLYVEFQGAALGYPFFAVVLVLLSLATGYYRWSENNTAMQLQLTLLPLTALVALSVHSWVWLLRIKKRLKAARQRMAELGSNPRITDSAPPSLVTEATMSPH